MDKYEFLDQIGSGSYGIVMKAKSKSNGTLRMTSDEIVAIKLIRKTPNSDNSELEEEVNNLIQLDHPNIIKLLEVYQNEQYIFLVQEYCACPFIDFVKKRKLNEEDLRVIVKQLLSALHYCHKVGVIHRDIKIQNIMFANPDDITSLKLIDFGLAGRITTESIYQAMGTAIYLAPEVIIGEYDERIDMWSLGILIYYTVNGVPPFQGRSARELYQNIVKGSSINYVPRIPGASEELNDLLARMLRYDKNERISAEHALKHMWVVLKQDSNKTIVKDLFLNKVLHFISKSKFLKLLAFQYSTRWKDSFCKPLKDALEAIDSDHDGIISLEEFLGAIDTFNRSICARVFSRQEAETIFAALDFNNNGQIDYLEFQTLFSSQILFSDDKVLLNEFKRMDLVDFLPDSRTATASSTREK